MASKRRIHLAKNPIPAEKVRQGQSGQRVFAILAVALVLAGVVWLGLEFWGEAIDSGTVENTEPSVNP